LGIQHLRWPITLSSHEAKAAEARMPIPRNDHMVVDSDTKEPAHLNDLLGHVDIGAGCTPESGKIRLVESKKNSERK
jgi:hypothetical protein